MPVSFFCKSTAANVWKSVASGSAAGLRRGRGKGTSRIIAKDLNKGQQIITGRRKLVLPSLNTEVIGSTRLQDVQDVGQNQEFDQKMQQVRKELSAFRNIREAPLDRGWTGLKAPGRKAGLPDDYNKTSFHNIDSIVLMRSIQTMTGIYGRTRNMQALVVNGNQIGLAGFATSSGNDGKSDVRQPQVQTVQKRTLVKRIVDECKHYYHGFRLLFIDLRISTRYVRMILNGEQLTRREHQQLVRSVSDLFRLVPFSVFIIVPFMEFLLPVFLKFFPSMLPSTFQTKKDKLAKIESQLKVKLEMAKFLQETLDDLAFKAKGESHSEEAKKFAKFFEEVRASGAGATNADIVRYSKLFEDEITLDSMTRQQLVACCRLLELQPIGTNAFLRFQLRMRLKALKADDEMIENEGISSLTVSELQAACRARGMRALGVPIERLQEQLAQWLELSLHEKIPPSLLLLSRALYVPENIPTSEQLKATIKSLPELAGTEVRYNIGKTEGKVDNKTKLEFIKREEEEIKREEEQESVESFKSNYDETLINKAEEVIERATKLDQNTILKIVKQKSEKNDLTMEFLESIERDLEEREREARDCEERESAEREPKASEKDKR